MSMLVWVAAGGAAGAVARYLVMSGVARVWGASFPWSTLTVNVVGSLVLGILVETLALKWSAAEGVRGFLVVGMLGAFTTFSTFSLDVAVLYERGAFAAAATYVAISVVLSVGAMFAGLSLARALLA